MNSLLCRRLIFAFGVGMAIIANSELDKPDGMLLRAFWVGAAAAGLCGAAVMAVRD